MNIDNLVKEADGALENVFKRIDEVALFNSEKILKAFQECGVSESDFSGTTGYGYGDVGRDKIESVYSHVFKTEDALVRNQFISGTHALTIAFFALLRPGDTLLSISGKPYDTLDSVIGFNDNESSLKSFGVKYEQIDLINDDFDYEKIKNTLLEKNIKLIEIQRSVGYSLRKTIDIEKLERVIKLIKDTNPSVYVMVDNCYCELVSTKEPSEVGADITVGSLIKNLGGGIASNGAYIVGKRDLIHLCSERLNVPGEAKEVGPSQQMNKMFLEGLYLAPSVVKSALKTAVFASYMLEHLGYKVLPRWNDLRSDIVEMITFNDKDKLIKFVEGIQSGSAIDSMFTPIPVDMPGYDDEVIMASGSFTQGSSIELSCDGPIRAPYVAYLQGSLTYEYGKLGIIKAIKKLLDEN